MAEGSGFDMSKMSTAGKILAGGGILYLISLFLPWNQLCSPGFSGGGISVPSVCVSASGMNGIGILDLLLVLAIIAMEVVTILGVQMNVGTATQRTLIGAGLTWALAVITILRVLIGWHGVERTLWGWIGIVLALVIAYGGFMRFQEGKSAGGEAPASGGGGFGS